MKVLTKQVKVPYGVQGDLDEIFVNFAELFYDEAWGTEGIKDIPDCDKIEAVFIIGKTSFTMEEFCRAVKVKVTGEMGEL